MRYKIEFSRFKHEINFIQYAQSLGYEIDQKKTTRRSVAMYQGHSDKIIVSKKNGTWIYFSVYDQCDNGTIIDFIQNRSQKSLLETGKELQLWMDGFVEQSLSSPSINLSDDTTYDPARIKKLFNYYSLARNHAYLKNRGITQQVLKSSRFADRVFQDKYKNAVFPHFKNGQACGLELKGENISLFVRGSEKTLWRSNIFKSDDCLVIAEAPIDAISYQILHNLSTAFYVATSGGFSKNQSDMIKSFIEDFNQFKEITIATDNNAGGDQITERLYRIIQETKFNGHIKRHSPDQSGQDWNDVLKNQLSI